MTISDAIVESRHVDDCRGERADFRGAAVVRPRSGRSDSNEDFMVDWFMHVLDKGVMSDES